MDFNFGLYPVITQEFCNGRSMIEVLKDVIAGGVKVVQLRQKDFTKKNLYELAIKYRRLTRENNVKLIINDFLDIALAVNADGVHLGQNDLPCHVARRLAPDMIIGISTHNSDEIKIAENEGATYVNIGPIFSTNTKKMIVKPLGLDYLKSVKIKLPFSVMGGIKKHNVKEVLECGVRNIAMVSEITMANDITVKTKELVEIIDNFKSPVV
ncbi:MAG: thiamine phosphate synthase [Spirochaetes bacterium]|nr:thiamine phosphate synthase [Spirochaetota bacterium]